MSNGLKREWAGTVPVDISEEEAGPDSFLLKFSFTSPKHVPDGIPEKDRLSNDEADRIHAVKAILDLQQPELAVIGRVRAGRVDTGKHTIDNLPMVQVATLRRAFANAGFYLTDVHQFFQEPRRGGQKGKYVVCLTYQRVADITKFPELSRATLDALRALANTTWQYCHVWDNPNRVVTINLVGRQEKANPRHAIVIRQRQLQAVAVEEPVTEEEE